MFSGVDFLGFCCYRLCVLRKRKGQDVRMSVKVIVRESQDPMYFRDLSFSLLSMWDKMLLKSVWRYFLRTPGC